jgi:hypothetical protein
MARAYGGHGGTMGGAGRTARTGYPRYVNGGPGAPRVLTSLLPVHLHATHHRIRRIRPVHLPLRHSTSPSVIGYLPRTRAHLRVEVRAQYWDGDNGNSEVRRYVVVGCLRTPRSDLAVTSPSPHDGPRIRLTPRGHPPHPNSIWLARPARSHTPPRPFKVTTATTPYPSFSLADLRAHRRPAPPASALALLG